MKFTYVFLGAGGGDCTTKRSDYRKPHSGSGFTWSGQSYCPRPCLCRHGDQTSNQLARQSRPQPSITRCTAGQPEYHQTGTNRQRCIQCIQCTCDHQKVLKYLCLLLLFQPGCYYRPVGCKDPKWDRNPSHRH